VASVRERDGVLLYGFEGSRDPDVDSALPELPRCVLAQPSGNLGEDLRRGVDEHPALPDVLESGIEPRRVVEEIGQLCQRLDSCVAGAHEDEAEVALGVVRGQRRVRELQLAEDVVAQVDGVRKALEPQAVFGEAGDRQRSRDRAEGDNEPLIVDLPELELGLDAHRSRRSVEADRLPEEEIRLAAHHAQRDDDVARLEGSRGGLREDRRIEHEVLAADDGRALLAEEPRDVGAGEAAAEDKGAAACLTPLQSALSLTT
jgi:hypothetical protein